MIGDKASGYGFDPFVKIMQDAGWYEMGANHIYIPGIDGPPMILGGKIYLPGAQALSGATLKLYLKSHLGDLNQQTDLKSLFSSGSQLGILKTDTKPVDSLGPAMDSATQSQLDSIYNEINAKIEKAKTPEEIYAIRDYYLPILKRYAGGE